MTQNRDHDLETARPRVVGDPRGPHRDGVSIAPVSPMQTAPPGETNNIGMALQMHAWAQVQSAYYMARGAPRLVTQCRQRLLDACKDWRFACDAVWAKPVGKEVKKGLGIRFAEAAAQCWTNLKVESTNICETEDMRIMRTTVTDLESNVSFTRDTAVDKWVLRKKAPKLPSGEKPKIWAYNNYGEAQYRVRATSDDMLMSQNAQLSKAERQLILKHIPKHIQDECKFAINQTLQNKASRGDRKMVIGLIDEFSEIKISPRQLEQYLGHDPEILSGIEIAMLRGLFYDLAENRVTFAEALASRHGGEGDASPVALPAAKRAAPERSRARPPQPQQYPGDEDLGPEGEQVPPPAQDPEPEHGDEQWQTQEEPRRPARQSPPPPEREDDDADLEGMDLESLDNLVDEDGQPVQMRVPQPRPPRRPADDGAPMSRTQQVLNRLPTRSNRGR